MVLALSMLARAAPAAPAPAGKALTPHPLERRLADAHARGDPTELARAANRLGVPGLLQVLRAYGARSSARAARAAALAGAALVDKSWLLLPALVGLAADRERAVALAAATAALRIAEDLRRPELQSDEELPAGELVEQAGRLRALARGRAVSLDVRVKVTLVLAQLLELVKLPPAELRPLLADPEPALRRAAVELFVHAREPSLLASLARLVAEDGAPAVARAAAATLCAEVEPRGRRPAPQLEAIVAAGAASRLRELAADRDASDDELLDFARCLRRSGGAADARALRAIAARSPALARRLKDR